MSRHALKVRSCTECRSVARNFAEETVSGKWVVPLTVVLTACIVGTGRTAEKQGGGEEAGPAVTTLGGTLVIVGGGKMPETIRDRFLELAGGTKARLVIIPTASGKAHANQLETLRSYAYWAPLQQTGKVASVVFFHTRKVEQANDTAFVKPLTDATGVWFGGGDQSLLMAAYKGTAVERELQQVLARGGVIGGTSAGAAVMSSLMIVRGNPVAEVGTGFGFLPDIVVDQHFEQRKRRDRLLGVLTRFPQYLGVGIDERTGIVVNLRGRSMTILGEEKVWVCVPATGGAQPNVKSHKAGEQVDLAGMNRSARADPPAAPAKEDPPPGTATLSHGVGR